jgi:hypothetical protein
VPQPSSDLERFLAGDPAETQDAPAVLLLLVLLLVLAAAF